MAERLKTSLVVGLWACLVWGLIAPRAEAEDAAPEAQRGIAANGLCGLTFAEFPTCPTHFLAVSGSAGYGYTESLGRIKGAHHRTAGSLGVGFTPLAWLSLSMRLDGRLDLHPPDSEGADSTMVGDPRFLARAGRDLGSDVTLGGSVGLWFPGADAPSFKLDASSIDLKALAAWTPRERPWSVLGTLGFRLDNSANSAPDLRRLRPGDRLSLGLSDANAVLAVVGGAYRLGERAEVFADLSGDLLVGKQAQALLKSPLRVSVGGRYFLSRALQFEAALTGSLSQRPSLRVTAPLVPVEPRVLLTAGVRFGIPSAKPAPADASPATEPEVGEPRSETGAARVSAKVTGTITDEQGAALPEVNVVLLAGETRRELITDGDGHFTFSDTPVGPVSLEASAVGFAPQTWQLEVTLDMGPLSPRALVAKADTGTLRCLTRTFGSEPLKAQIVVRDGRGREVAKGESDEQGLYEIELSPGAYQVIIMAPGYRPHRRSVKVSSNGVAILNLDMREQ